MRGASRRRGHGAESGEAQPFPLETWTACGEESKQVQGPAGAEQIARPRCHPPPLKVRELAQEGPIRFPEEGGLEVEVEEAHAEAEQDAGAGPPDQLRGL